MLLHVDGCCARSKDVQISDGLHILGAAPAGDGELDLVLAILRARQLFGGEQHLPGLREALGLAEDGSDERTVVDAAEARARDLLAGCRDTGWDAERFDEITDDPQVTRILRFAATEVVPRLAGDGRRDRPGVAGTGGSFHRGRPVRIAAARSGQRPADRRNFYSVDPKAVPSRLAYDTVWRWRIRCWPGTGPTTATGHDRVGLSVWGTSAMRTSGDDVAEVLALLGVRPVWDDASRRVVNLEAIGLQELGRPRIDVTVRISGFFRDAFPHVVTMLDDAVRMVAALDEPAEQNFVRAHARSTWPSTVNERRATTRIFGSKPAPTGRPAQLIDSRNLARRC